MLSKGVAEKLLGILKDILRQILGNQRWCRGIKSGLRKWYGVTGSQEVGGAQLLGAAERVIQVHVSGKAKGLRNAIRQAKLCVANDLCGTMQSALAEVAAKAAAEKTDAE